MDWVISGRVVKGARKAAFFTRLDWVQSQCRSKLGFEPFTGTLNLEIEAKAVKVIDGLAKKSMDELVPPDKTFCRAKVCTVYLGNIRGALILPDKDVNIHEKHTIEVLAPVRLRDAMDLKDGDRVALRFKKDLSRRVLDVDAALFDLDGTLIDSIESYYRIVEVTLEKLGFPPVSRQIILKAANNDQFNWDLVLPDVPGETSKKTGERAWAVIEKVYPKEFLKNVHPFPHTRPVLQSLHNAGIRIAVVTSTPEKNINDKMKIFAQSGVSNLVEIVISAGDAERKKPFPDPLLLCRDRMGLSSDQCLYIGDTGIDIQAGRAAGMKTAGILTGFDTQQDLETHHPDVILESLADLPGVLGI